MRTVLIDIAIPGIGQEESFEPLKTALNYVRDRLTLDEFTPPCKFEARLDGKKCGEVVIVNQTI
jgi:hypothetical protein